MWGPFEIVIRETFTSTLNCLAGCDANPTVPEIETPEHTGPISVTKSPPPPGSPPNTPDKVVIFTNGKEYEYDPDSPPPASEVFTKQPKTPTFPAELKPPDPNDPDDPSKLHLVTSTTMADVDGDGDLDVIATFKDDPDDPTKPGTTKVYLNPKTPDDPNPDAPDDFSGVTGIEIEAPVKGTPDGEPPITTDVVVADVNPSDDPNTKSYPDIVTVNDAGENVLYFGGPTGPKLNEGKILGTDLTYDAPSKTYTGNEDDPNVITERKSPSQSVQVADVDGDGKPDIIVSNLPTVFDPAYPTTPAIDMTPNVVYFQDDQGNYPTATPIGAPPIGHLLEDLLDEQVKLDEQGNPEMAMLTPPGKDNPEMAFTPPVVDAKLLELMTSMTMADVDDDGDMDLIATFKDEPGDPNDPNDPDKPGTTKVYLNPSSDPDVGDFTSVTPIDIEAPDEDTTDGEPPITTDVVVADVDKDGHMDIVTVNDKGENVLYFGPVDQNGPLQPGKILGTDLEYDAPSKTYTDTNTNTDPDTDPDVIAERMSPSQSVQVADVDGDGKPDIVVANFPTLDPNDPTIDMTPNVVYFQDDQGNFPTATKLAPSSKVKDDQGNEGFSKTTKIVVADVDGDGKMDLVVANRDQENQIFLAKEATGKVLKETTLETAPPSTDRALLDSLERYPSQTTKIVVADVDKDGQMDLVVANRDDENQIFLAKDSPSDKLDPTNLAGAPSSTLALPFHDWPDGFIGAEWQGSKLTTMDIAVADFNNDGVPDIVTAEKGAPNLLYLGEKDPNDPAKGTGDFSGVTPIPIALKDAPTWYESAYEGTDVATGATIGGSERLTWGQYKGEVDDTYSIEPVDVDNDGYMDLVVGNRDQTAKVYFNDKSADVDPPNFFEPKFKYRTKLGEAYDDGPSAVGVEIEPLLAGGNPAVDSTGLATAVDLNGDGYPDVVTGTEVYLNPGHGEFTNVQGMPWWQPMRGIGCPISSLAPATMQQHGPCSACCQKWCCAAGQTMFEPKQLANVCLRFQTPQDWPKSPELW